MVGRRDEEGVQVAVWPDDVPSKYEDKVLSIICGNSHLHWAIHNGLSDNFSPILFWRTPPLLEDDKDDEPCAVLARHIPKQAHAVVFGSETASATLNTASETAMLRRIPALSIYIISTNLEHESGLEFLFKDVATRMCRLQSTDFFTKEQGIYDGMGVDRAAALAAASEIYRPPVMVMDGGTAWTYTAMGRDNKVIGGGISLGLKARFQALSDYCGDLPNIQYQEFCEAINEIKKTKKPMPTFAGDTKTAMLTTACSEICSQTQYIVKQFLAAVKTEDKGDYLDSTIGEMDVDKKANEPTIAVTGGDANFLGDILEGIEIVERESGNSMPSDGFQIRNSKHLCHYGIGFLLKNRLKNMTISKDDELRQSLTGQRVAKMFENEPDFDGDYVYRGSIVSIRPGKVLEEDLFSVRYDDGDMEQMELLEIYDSLKLYSEQGEKLEPENLIPKIAERKKDSGGLATTLTERSEKLKEEIKESAKKREQRKDKLKKRQSTLNMASKRARRGVQDKTIYINKRVAKAFDQEDENGKVIQEIFFGTVDRLSGDAEPQLWHIQYDDDDEEEFDERDIKRALKLYEQHSEDDPKRNRDSASEPTSMEVEGSGENTSKTNGATAAADAPREASAAVENSTQPAGEAVSAPPLAPALATAAEAPAVVAAPAEGPAAAPLAPVPAALIPEPPEPPEPPTLETSAPAAPEPPAPTPKAPETSAPAEPVPVVTIPEPPVQTAPTLESTTAAASAPTPAPAATQ